MFICAVTKRPSQPREKPTRLAVEWRPKTYHNINPEGDVVYSEGREIVREINVSAEGMEILTKLAKEREAVDDPA